MKYVEVLINFLKRLQNILEFYQSYFSNIYKIDDIEVENNKIYDKDYIIGK